MWARTQDKHLGSKATTRANGSMWIIRVIETVLLEWLKLWKLRNEDRHGQDMESRRRAETSQTIREVKQFYAAHDGKVTARLQWLFAEPLEERRERNIENPNPMAKHLETHRGEKLQHSFNHRMTESQEKPHLIFPPNSSNPYLPPPFSCSFSTLR